MTHFEKDRDATVRYYEGFAKMLNECIENIKKAKDEDEMGFYVELLSTKQETIAMQFSHEIDQYNKEYGEE